MRVLSAARLARPSVHSWRPSPPLRCGHPTSTLASVPATRPRIRTRLWLGVGLGASSLLGAGSLLLADTSRDGDVLAPLRPAALAKTNEHLQSASISDLLRLYIVYFASGQPLLVSTAPTVIAVLESVRDVPLVGPAIWNAFAWAMTHTMYKTFVGAASLGDCAPLVQRLSQDGIGVLLNYGSEPRVLSRHDKVRGLYSDRVKDVEDAIDALADAAPPDDDGVRPSLYALKLSGLIRDPGLLGRSSEALESSTSYLRGVALEGPTFPTAPQLSDEDHEDLAELHEALRGVMGKAKDKGVRVFVDGEQTWYQPAVDHLVACLSAEYNRSAQQPASSLLGWFWKPRALRPSPAIVNNTYQCYLEMAPDRLRRDMAKATQHGYSFGAKLVRGAYMESEAEHAKRKGLPSPVWDTKELTDKAFSDCVRYMEQQILDELTGKVQGRTALLVASHNATSAAEALEFCLENGLAHATPEGNLAVDDRLRGRLGFAQLFGMSDNLTTTLATLITWPGKPNMVPFCYKACHYSDVDTAIPYLLRRASENRSILEGDPSSGRGGAKSERRAVGRELRRRIGLSF